MQLFGSGQLQLLLPLLLQLVADSVSIRFSRAWPGFTSHYGSFKPFKPKRARFAAPIRGFSSIFQNDGLDRWQRGAAASLRRSPWGYSPATPPPLQPIPLARNHYQSFPIPRPSPVSAPPRRHSFVPASSIRDGKVPTHFMTDAELHGLVCVPASSLASALAGHRDHVTSAPAGQRGHVTRHRDGSVTTHRTVVTGADGGTTHSTRITSGPRATVVETRTNSSSGVQRHEQSVRRGGGGVVRTSTGSAFSGGSPGQPTHADVITSSSSEGSNSQSRAMASGYDISGKALPARSMSHSASRDVSDSDVIPDISRALTEGSPSSKGDEPAEEESAFGGASEEEGASELEEEYAPGDEGEAPDDDREAPATLESGTETESALDDRDSASSQDIHADPSLLDGWTPGYLDFGVGDDRPQIKGEEADAPSVDGEEESEEEIEER